MLYYYYIAVLVFYFIVGMLYIKVLSKDFKEICHICFRYIVIFVYLLYVKVLNRDFEETCNISSDLRCILFMAFNPIKDELIIGGIGGAKVRKIISLNLFARLNFKIMSLARRKKNFINDVVVQVKIYLYT